MSTRAMARQYSGNNSGDGMYQLGASLRSLFGGDDIKGGPSVDPATGRVNYQPFKGSSGFFGRGSRKTAEDVNRQILIQMLLQQMKGDTDVNVENIRGKNSIEGIKEQGNQLRLTQKEKADLEATLGEKRTAQLIKESNAKVLTDQGIIANDENQAEYDTTTRPGKLRSVVNKDLVSGDEAQLTHQALMNPVTADALTKGLQQKYLAPLYQNQKSTLVDSPANTFSSWQKLDLDPTKNGFTPMFQSGPLATENVVSTPDTFGKDEQGNPMMMKGGQKVTRSFTPGQQSGAIADLIRQASGLSASDSDTNTIAPPPAKVQLTNGDNPSIPQFDLSRLLTAPPQASVSPAPTPIANTNGFRQPILQTGENIDDTIGLTKIPGLINYLMNVIAPAKNPNY